MCTHPHSRRLAHPQQPPLLLLLLLPLLPLLLLLPPLPPPPHLVCMGKQPHRSMLTPLATSAVKMNPRMPASGTDSEIVFAVP
jgi:hypothetical protein